MFFFSLFFSRLPFFKQPCIPSKYLGELYLLQSSSLDKSIFWVVQHHLLLSHIVSPLLLTIRVLFC